MGAVRTWPREGGLTPWGWRYGALLPANAQVRAPVRLGEAGLPGWGLGHPPVWRPSPSAGALPGGAPWLTEG